MYRKYRQDIEHSENVVNSGHCMVKSVGQTSRENKNTTNEVQEKIELCWNEIEKQCQEYRPQIRKEVKNSGWKVARVFVSSTFTDFFNEREILVKKVFPELREWCNPRHINLIECDLRWGVPKEATTQDVISTCLEELDRCHNETDGQPFFLGLLGKRYGWIPSEKDISTEMREKYHWVDNISITFMEMLHGAYRCKSQNAAFFIRSDEVIESIPEKSIKRFVDEETLNQQQLIELKKRLKQRFPEHTYDYSCKVDGVVDHEGREWLKFSDLDKFCEQTTEFLKEAITKMYGDQTTVEINEEQIERENQRLFIENKSESVVGQDHLLKTLKSYLKGEPLTDVPISEKSTSFIRDPKFWGPTSEDDNMIMCVKGRPGFGKSTLLSKIVVDMVQEGYDVFYHFVGCSLTSKNTEFLYKRLIKALEVKGQGQADIVKSKDLKNMPLSDMMIRMRELLPVLREQQTKLLIVIDAVNELPDSDTYKHMSWLPPQFPGNIKCIVSSADDHPPTIARLTEHSCYVCEFGPISREDAELMITIPLKKFNKKLDSDQLSRIVSKPCATNPLWLNILTEELRVFGDFRTLDQKIDKVSDSIESLLTEIITRLISEDNTGLVKKTLCLLLCSTGGIQTNDLCNMLGDIDKKQEIAPLYFSQTRRVLKPYIKEMGVPASISFYHMEIYKCASKLLLPSNYSRTEYTKILALYYTKWCSDPRSRALFAPVYCVNANLNSLLVDFFSHNDAARFVPDWQRSAHFRKIRCSSSADYVFPKPVPVVMCNGCSSNTRGQIFRTRNEDCCVVCRGPVHFSKTQAYLCQSHAFGHNDKMGQCLYCSMPVQMENGEVKNYMGTTGKLCNECGFGNFGKQCAMIPM